MGVVPLRPEFDQVKVVCFDLDDTLCGYWSAAKEGLAKSVRLHLPDPGLHDRFRGQWATTFRRFVETLPQTHWYAKYLAEGGVTRTELMRRTLDELGVLDEQLARDLSQTYHVERQAALELFPDALTVLASLKPDYKLALVTNGPADIQREEISKLEIEPFFDGFFIEGEMGHGKPDPRVFDRVLTMFQAEPHQCLMVGNSYRHDIRPAISHGFRTVWVVRETDVAPTSVTGRPEEKPADAPSPDLVIGNLSELLA